MARTAGDGHDRYLHRRSELGYAHTPGQAVVQEPQAITESEQRAQVEQARQLARARRLDQWQRTRAFCELALAKFATPATLRQVPGLQGELVGIQARLRKVDGRIAGKDPRQRAR